MRALFVAPMQRSTGEAATVVGMVRELTRRGHAARVLASASLAPGVRGRVGCTVDVLGDDLAENQACWRRVVHEMSPSHVVFADFPMMAGFSSGVAPLVDQTWSRELDSSSAILLTLDHLGYGQRAVDLHFGPPHLCSRAERVPEPPTGMRLLLPCPIHEPGPVDGRRGTPFQLDLPTPVEDPLRVRERTRARLGIGCGPLVLHAVSQWTRDFCDAFELAYFDVLARVLRWYFDGAPEPVTVVSVNGLEPSRTEDSGVLRVIAASTMGEQEFGELVASSDLFINENPFSSTLGRVVVEGIPAASFVNSMRLAEVMEQAPAELRTLALELEQRRLGSVFPYRVLPLDFRAELETTGLFRDNSFQHTFHELELWNGEATRSRLQALLFDRATGDELRSRQQTYREAVRCLPRAHEVMLASELSG